MLSQQQSGLLQTAFVDCPTLHAGNSATYSFNGASYAIYKQCLLVRFYILIVQIGYIPSPQHINEYLEKKEQYVYRQLKMYSFDWRPMSLIWHTTKTSGSVDHKAGLRVIIRSRIC